MLAKLKNILFDTSKTNRKPAWCPVCGSKQVSFLPLPEYYRDNARRHGFKYFGKGEMTSNETYTCSNCGASDRQRMYML